MSHLNPLHRFVVMRCGIPVHTATNLLGVAAYLWGRDINAAYVVYDYERSVPVDDADIVRWQKAHWPVAT